MSDIREEAKTWFNSNKQRNALLILTVIMGVLLLLSVKSCEKAKTNLVISNQNNTALSDSVRITTNKVGDLEASKSVLISEKKDLDNLSKDLAAEVKKEQGKVYSLNQYIIGIKNKPGDTIYINNTLIKYPNGEFGCGFDYYNAFDDKNNIAVSGISKFKITGTTITPTTTLLTKYIINIKLVTGLREKDGNIEIFVRSDYPGMNVIDLEGAIIDPKKNPILKKFTVPKKWCVGPYVGFGFSTSIQPSVQLGIGIQYSLFQF